MINIKIPKENQNIDADIFEPESGTKSNGKCPLVIFLHGFKGNKDWGFIPYYCEEISKAGFIVVKYNHSFTGYNASEPGLIDVPNFEQMTISRQLEDINDLIQHLLEMPEIKNNHNGEIVLIGHSMGGAVSLLHSYLQGKINKIILLASIAYFDRYTERQKALWKSAGVIEFPNTRTNQILRLKSDFLLDLEANFEKFDIINAVSKLSIPIKIFHGEQDLTVKINEAEMLIAANNNIQKEYIPSASHTFNIDTKGIKSNPILNHIINESIIFLKENND